jgi:RNA polymerase sigma-70 factor (TIGR02960 family)
VDPPTAAIISPRWTPAQVGHGRGHRAGLVRDEEGGDLGRLYRIATNACLTALEQRSRRPMPSGFARPNTAPDARWLDAATPVDWLQPIPDTFLGPDDPAGIIDSRAGARLAFVAALQHLSPRRRAVLILCDVLSWRSAEVVAMLGTTSAAVSSALLRARAQLAKAAPALEEIAEPAEPQRLALLDRYAAAFHSADITRLVQLFRADIALEMPPLRQWFGFPNHRS